jgi:serine/threonine protein kinase
MMELILEMIQKLSALKLTHGDIKPENIMLCKTSSGAYQLKLIDPISRNELGLSDGPNAKTVFTVTYNPKGLFSAQADEFGLALILFELVTGEIPFKKYVRKTDLTFGDSEIRRPLGDIFDPLRPQYESNKFASFLVEQMKTIVAGGGNFYKTLKTFPKPVIQRFASRHFLTKNNL